MDVLIFILAVVTPVVIQPTILVVVYLIREKRKLDACVKSLRREEDYWVVTAHGVEYRSEFGIIWHSKGGHRLGMFIEDHLHDVVRGREAFKE